MTLVNDIIRDAYRESNINAIGVSPSALQTDEALRLLRRIVMGVYGQEVGENLMPLSVGQGNIIRPSDNAQQLLQGIATVPANARLMLNLEEDVTVYLPSCPADGTRFSIVDVSGNLASNAFTVVGNGRTIEDTYEVTIDENKATRDWMYRDDLGDWVRINPIDINLEFPFPPEYDDYFIISLAMRLNPRNGAAIDPQSQMVWKDTKSDLMAKYRQTRMVPSELGLLVSTQRRYCQTGYDSNYMFDTGYLFLYPTYWS